MLGACNAKIGSAAEERNQQSKCMEKIYSEIIRRTTYLLLVPVCGEFGTMQASTGSFPWQFESGRRCLSSRFDHGANASKRCVTNLTSFPRTYSARYCEWLCNEEALGNWLSGSPIFFTERLSSAILCACVVTATMQVHFLARVSVRDTSITSTLLLGTILVGTTLK